MLIKLHFIPLLVKLRMLLFIILIFSIMIIIIKKIMLELLEFPVSSYDYITLDRAVTTLFVVVTHNCNTMT